MLPQELIRAKRQGAVLSADDIGAFVAGVADGSVTEGQVAAFCMALHFRPLSLDERVALTAAMTRSGTVLDWPSLGIDGPIVDKHSTGGVGDKVSLLLAPIVAAVGGLVPMISGRGLGHTGGTLDKLEAIPGFGVMVNTPRFAEILRDVGCAIVGASGDLAPADKRMYAIRDTTGTVESLDLITASILSKKLAAGLRGLVMDVKFGNGAFLPTFEESVALAESIVGVANGAGTPTVALLTDMNEVLGTTAGNAVETHESIAALRDPAAADPRLMEVTRLLCAEMLALVGVTADRAAGLEAVDAVLADGSAAERFQRMVAAQGGPADLIDRPTAHLVAAPVVKPVPAPAAGYVGAVDTRALGVAVVAMGGGRTHPDQRIDHRVGLTDIAGIGRRVDPASAPLALVHAADEAQAAAAVATVQAAFTLVEAAPPARPLVERRIVSDGQGGTRSLPA